MLHLVKRLAAFLIAGIALALATAADERRAALGEHKTVDLARTRAVSILLGMRGSSYLGGSGGSDFVRRARPLAVGDFNGDGFEDIAVGAPETNARAGAAYIFFGNGSGQFSQRPDAEMAGTARGDELGFALAASDVDGDGIDDLLVGAPGASSADREASGALFILAGSSSLGGTIDLRSASRIIYGPESQGRFGSSIAATSAQGGYILVGAPRSHSGSGAAYIIQKSALMGIADAAAQSASVIIGAASSEVGTAVAMADLNADGSADFIVGAPFATNLASDPEAGAVYVIIGRQDLSPSFDLSAGQYDAAIYGSSPGDHFGASLIAGDITADGAAELIVGAPDRSALGRAGAGQVYVIRVRSGFSGGVDQLEPLVIYGAQGDHLGATVALGFASGDETADLLLGAPGALEGKGSVSIIFGGSRLLGLSKRDLAVGQDDLRILGAERGEGSGWSIAAINAGSRLLAISAPLAGAPQGDAEAGKLYILPQDNRPPTVQLSAPNGGETIKMGQFFDIRWSASDPDGNNTLTRVDIFLSLDGGNNFPIIIASNLPGSTSSFKWQVLLTATTLRARVRVVVTDNAGAQAFDDSDANFIIVDEGVPVTLLSPNGGEQISSTQNVTIRWDVAFADRIRLGGFDLYYSTDGGATFSQTIALNLGPNTFSFNWQPPPLCASRTRVLVVAVTQAGATTSDRSDADFTIFNPGPTIDAGRMLLNDEMSRLVLFTIAPAGGVEVLFNSGTLVEISKDQNGTQFATFDKTPKVKRGGRKLITRGLIDGKDLLEFFPIGEVRVLKVTNPSCGITKMTVRRFGFQLFPLSP